MQISPASNPTPPRSANAFSALAGNIDTFLTLLTTQLRNQDPLKPLDTEKFTSQLVQFASVEQSIKTNSHLEALIALQGATDRQSALDFIGREARVATNMAQFANGRADWTYVLPQDARAVSLSVLDEKGNVAARLPGAASAGAHAFSWNGTMPDGRAAPDGVYRLQIDAIAADGAAIAADIESQARVLAASFGAGAPKLETTLGAIELHQIRRVADFRE
jgi:flagellar basal-body rod modification protein FlgD